MIGFGDVVAGVEPASTGAMPVEVCALDSYLSRVFAVKLSSISAVELHHIPKPTSLWSPRLSGRNPSRGLMSISAFVPRFVNEQPVVLTGAASSSCLPHRCFVSMEREYKKPCMAVNKIYCLFCCDYNISLILK